jgi:hypothetical protein
MRPGGRDLNRCFRPPWIGDEGAVAAEALAAFRAARPEALVDLHNNTGHNPPYGVGAYVDGLRLGVTALFAARFIHNTIRLGALSEVGADELNAVAIECGRAGDPAADAVARCGLERFLTCDRLPDGPPLDAPVAVLGDPIRVTLRAGTRVVFDQRPHPDFDFTIRHDIDRHNFEPLLPGVPVGWLGRDAAWPLVAVGADGIDVSREYFTVRRGLVETRRHTVPIMMTTDPAAVSMDCLFYIVHER